MWAVLGGTFDPVHNGHLTLAQDVLSMKMLDGLLLVPSFHPPHKPKNCYASYEDRLAMLILAAENYNYFAVSRIEEELSGSGFTLHTVRALKKKYPATGFYFLIGADNIEAIKDWYKPEEIIDEIKIIAGTRPGFDPDRVNHRLADKIEFITTTPVDISSSEIRKKIKSGAGRQELVKHLPEKVADYIIEKKLYR